jgi:hypothetical protein
MGYRESESAHENDPIFQENYREVHPIGRILQVPRDLQVHAKGFGLKFEQESAAHVFLQRRRVPEKR